MKRSRQAADPEWKQLLRLGDQLVGQHSPAAQSERIVETIHDLLAGQVQVWLSNPAYLLAGGSEIETLPQAPASELALKAYETLQVQLGACALENAPTTNSDSDRAVFATAVAVPMATNGTLLGVVQVERPDGPAFSNRDLTLLEGLVNHAAIAMEITRQETLKNWRYEQLSLVRTVSAQIANLREPNALYSQVTQLIQETFDFYYVALFTLDEREQRLRFRASAGQNRQSPLTTDFTLGKGEGIIGTVWETEEEIVAPDVRLEPRYHYLDNLPETQSEAALPLKVENRIFGVLDFQSDQRQAFHEIDLLVLHTLADNIALALESAHLYDDLQRRAAQISSVFEVSHALASILDLDALLNEVVKLNSKAIRFPVRTRVYGASGATANYLSSRERRAQRGHAKAGTELFTGRRTRNYCMGGAQWANLLSK